MKTFMNFQGCVVPKEDLDVYDNHADMSSDDVNHTVVSLSYFSLIGSLRPILINCLLKPSVPHQTTKRPEEIKDNTFH